MNPRASVLALALASGSLCIAPLAHAQAEGEPTPPAETAEPTEEAKAEAKQRFARGIDLYQDGDYGLALIEFQRVYELVPDYRVLYNIGQVSIQLGRYASATQVLQRYLSEGGDKIPPDRAKAVQSDLEMLKGRTAFLNVTSKVEGATVYVDDRDVGTTPLSEPLLVDAGEHKLQLRKTGYVSNPQQVALAGGQTAELELALTPEAKGGERTIVVERPGAQIEKSDRNTAMWIGWSATGVLAVSTAVVGGLFLAKRSQLKDDEKTAYNEGDTTYQDDYDSARTLQIATDVLGGATIVAAGISVYLTLTRDKKPSPEQDSKKKTARATGPFRSIEARAGIGQVQISGTF